MAAVRSRGELRLRFSLRAGGTHLSETYQSGCLRARLPNTPAGARPCVVIMNTSGGLAGGDRLQQSIRWDEGASASAVNQAAEKVYRSLGEDARIELRLVVGAGARAEWLPQEAIVFDRARLSRSAEVELGAGASLIAIEAAVLGRTAMGEHVRAGAVRDSWRIVREGRIVYADVQRLEGPIDRLMERPAVGGGARACAVVIHASGDAARRLEGVRQALGTARGRAAASAWNGLLVTRLLAPDGEALRHDILATLAVLRDGAPPPRVWTC
jgi:urease accessory protein